MPREIDECSYSCDCGHQSNFFPRTITDLKHLSLRRVQRLSEGAGMDEHTIVFEGGRMVKILCPRKGDGGARDHRRDGARQASCGAGLAGLQGIH